MRWNELRKEVFSGFETSASCFGRDKNKAKSKWMKPYLYSVQEAKT